ncbi:DUF3127 domain-containing protein [Emticicia sp.]|uniref:DUF3127 domain-containing protein n=1 Tax=Emticicia sp. TaxID=1930953 RepID=UPI0037503AFB
MELTGTIIKIKEIENFPSKTEDAKDFQKREFWLQISVGGIPHEKYSQTVALELHGDKVTLLDSFKEGQEVITAINLKGKVIEDR